MAPVYSGISIHAPHEGGDYRAGRTGLAVRNFNPRPPRGGRQEIPADVCFAINISIHAPHEGGDIFTALLLQNPYYFNPRPPRGGRHICTHPGPRSVLFQSTPPTRGATAAHLPCHRLRRISIHAPHEGGDYKGVRTAMSKKIISIHAPHEGGDRLGVESRYAQEHFNPRPPRGGRQQRCTVLPADL